MSAFRRTSSSRSATPQLRNVRMSCQCSPGDDLEDRLLGIRELIKILPEIQEAIASRSPGWQELKVWPTAKVLQHNTGSINPGEGPDHRSFFPVFLRSVHRVLVCWWPCAL